MDVPSAEMVKLAANAYLATRISFINEIANVCELVGADIEHVAQGMGLDKRIGTHYLRAGIGYGGSCFPKDVSFLKLLAGNSGYHFHLVTSVMEVNELQMRRPIGKLQKHLGSLRGKRIAILGLAFKPNTDDLREAPSTVLISRLLAEVARPGRPPAAGRVPDRPPRAGRRRARDHVLRGGPGRDVPRGAEVGRPGDRLRRGAGAARPRGRDQVRRAAAA